MPPKRAAAGPAVGADVRTKRQKGETTGLAALADNKQAVTQGDGAKWASTAYDRAKPASRGKSKAVGRPRDAEAVGPADDAPPPVDAQAARPDDAAGEAPPPPINEKQMNRLRENARLSEELSNARGLQIQTSDRLNHLTNTIEAGTMWCAKAREDLQDFEKREGRHVIRTVRRAVEAAGRSIGVLETQFVQGTLSFEQDRLRAANATARRLVDQLATAKRAHDLVAPVPDVISDGAIVEQLVLEQCVWGYEESSIETDRALARYGQNREYASTQMRNVESLMTAYKQKLQCIENSPDADAQSRKIKDEASKIVMNGVRHKKALNAGTVEHAFLQYFNTKYNHGLDDVFNKSDASVEDILISMLRKYRYYKRKHAKDPDLWKRKRKLGEAADEADAQGYEVSIFRLDDDFEIDAMKALSARALSENDHGEMIDAVVQARQILPYEHAERKAVYERPLYHELRLEALNARLSRKVSSLDVINSFSVTSEEDMRAWAEENAGLFEETGAQLDLDTIQDKYEELCMAAEQARAAAEEKLRAAIEAATSGGFTVQGTIEQQDCKLQLFDYIYDGAALTYQPVDIVPAARRESIAAYTRRHADEARKRQWTEKVNAAFPFAPLSEAAKHSERRTSIFSNQDDSMKGSLDQSASNAENRGLCDRARYKRRFLEHMTRHVAKREESGDWDRSIARRLSGCGCPYCEVLDRHIDIGAGRNSISPYRYTIAGLLGGKEADERGMGEFSHCEYSFEEVRPVASMDQVE